MPKTEKLCDGKYIDRSMRSSVTHLFRYSHAPKRCAALHAAVELVKKDENQGKNIVMLSPDTGDRYLSTDAVPRMIQKRATVR